MRIRPAPLVPFALLFFVACAPLAPGRGLAAAEAPPAAPAGTAKPAPESADLPREANPDDPLCAPLLLEPDFGFGTSVVMRRLPTASDLEDMHLYTGLRQVLLALPEWPLTYVQIRPLQQVILPDGAEFVVLLPGWPPTREALGAWNLVGGHLRLIMVVDGPPTDRALIAELNHLRPLERVIVQTEHPSRSGFERLQRPLSFRVVKP